MYVTLNDNRREDNEDPTDEDAQRSRGQIAVKVQSPAVVGAAIAGETVEYPKQKKKIKQTRDLL